MTLDRFDARLARRAGPLLGVFNESGVLSSADVHVAQRLGRLGGESDERVLLAAALAVRAVRGGSVCVELADAASVAIVEDEAVVRSDGLPWPDLDAWTAAVEASPLVAVGVRGDPGRPLRHVQGRLYLDRYWRQEQVVRVAMDARAASAPPALDAAGLQAALGRLFDDAADLQRLAASTAATGLVTVITGGPGTGKTTTVARLLAALHAGIPSGEPALRVALAAPTGKAAARLQEAVRAEVGRLDAQDGHRVGSPTASTLHRLLGWRRGSTTRFLHDRDNRLPHDVVIVDETSMVSLTLMSRLLEALRPDARLVLVGDPDQLASVEAGAVLGDLVASRRQSGVVRLEVVHRYGMEISALAEAIRQGRADEAVALLRQSSGTVALLDLDAAATLWDDAATAGAATAIAARAGDAGAALAGLEQHRVLCAHRRGPFGVAQWSEQVERAVAARVQGYGQEGEWYPGRPLLVTANDYDTGLFNGDTGVVVADSRAGVVAAFGSPGSPVLVRPHRLSAVQTVHAMTVHRGQGSQFSRVSLVLPESDSPLLTRELLYTAVTRARDKVRVLGTEDAVRAAVARPVRRASGLRHPLPP